jgi:hypothetical protein
LGIILIPTEDKGLGSQEVDMIRREDFQVLQDTEGFYGHRPSPALREPGRLRNGLDGQHPVIPGRDEPLTTGFIWQSL